jgi:hypothetical protein
MMACASFLQALKDSKSVEDGDDSIPESDELPNEMWLKIFSYLNSTALNAVHLVSKKFHSLANSFEHSLDLACLCRDFDCLARFNESTRKYKAISGVGSDDRNLELEQAPFQQILEKLKTGAGESVRTLNLEYCELSPTLLYELLKQLPNLETLELKKLESLEWYEDDVFSELNMKKLVKIKIKEIEEPFCWVIEQIKSPKLLQLDCRIQPVTDNLLQFITSNLGSLKTLKFWCLGYRRDPTPWIRQLEAGNFETLLLLAFQVDPPAYAQLLKRQVNLKKLKLYNVHLSEEVLNSIFNHCQELEMISFNCGSLSFAHLNGIQKLRKLKYLSFGNFGQISQFPRGKMDALIEIRFYKLDGASEEFLSELCDCFPNLKVMKINRFNQEVFEQIRSIFKLEKLEFGNAAFEVDLF